MDTVPGQRRSPAKRPVMVGGKAASVPLRQDRALSEQVVQHFIRSVAPCATLPGEELRGDVTTVVRACIHLAASKLDGRQDKEELVYLRRASAQWAREGVPINAIHHAIHEGMKVTLQQCASTAAQADIAVLREIGKRLIEVMGSVSATVAAAYTAELETVIGEHHSAMHTLITALLGGRHTGTMAREFGLPVAEGYFVITLAIPATVGPLPRAEHIVVRNLRRELEKRCPTALSLLSADDGTLLVPTDYGDHNLDQLLADLAAAIKAPITATVIPAATDQVPQAHQRARELLTVADAARRGPGLYRFTDLAVEYQLTRPGPGQHALATLLNPLDKHPELLETLTVYIRLDCNKKRTARALHVHHNTIHYRFKRIASLVGVDPTLTTNAWYLHSALLARGITDLPASKPPAAG